jgi:hypothetical protein
MYHSEEFIDCHNTPARGLFPCSKQPCPKRDLFAEGLLHPYQTLNQTNQTLIEDFSKAKNYRDQPHCFSIHYARDYFKTTDNRSLYCIVNPCANQYKVPGVVTTGISETPNTTNEQQARELYTPTFLCKKDASCHLSRLTDKQDI